MNFSHILVIFLVVVSVACLVGMELNSRRNTRQQKEAAPGQPPQNQRS